jgi:hypothetical protein
MRSIKKFLIIALVILLAGQIATRILQGSAERKEPPVISCPDTVLEISARDSESALLVDVTATDNQDGDLTSQIIVGGTSKLITNDTAKVTYLVFDKDHNMASCTRYIRYTDYQRPRFSILQPLVYSTTEDASLLERLAAYDVVDGDISNRIRVSTLAATDNSQIYDITIQITNSVGDTARLKLPVLRLDYDPMRPNIKLSNYLIYIDANSSFDATTYLSSVSTPQGSISVNNVTIESDVDISTAGTYYVKYTYTANGSTGIAILTVVVQ